MPDVVGGTVDQDVVVRVARRPGPGETPRCVETVADAPDAWQVRPPAVEVVDTTGAGDSFIGVLTAAQAPVLVTARPPS